jgi:hypothetical protein
MMLEGTLLSGWMFLLRKNLDFVSREGQRGRRTREGMKGCARFKFIHIVSISILNLRRVRISAPPVAMIAAGILVETG